MPQSGDGVDTAKIAAQATAALPATDVGVAGSSGNPFTSRPLSNCGVASSNDSSSNDEDEGEMSMSRRRRKEKMNVKIEKRA